MKRILLILLFSILTVIVNAQTSVYNPQTIGLDNRNQVAKKSLQAGSSSTDTFVVKGKTILDNLRGFGTGIVGIDNIGKLSWHYDPTTCATTSTTTRSVCEFYSFNGTTYTNTGIYKYVTTNAAGCDSTATLNLTIKRSSTASFAVDICGCYFWHDNFYCSSGTYVFTDIHGAANGCDSTETLYLIISPICPDSCYYSCGQVDSAIAAGGGAYLPLAGGTMDNGSHIYFGSGGQNISQGTFDNGTGGDSGISLNCAVGYELNWQGGHMTSSYNNGANFVPLQVDSGLLVHGQVGVATAVFNGGTGIEMNGGCNTIGTTDDNDLVIKRNNVLSGLLNSSNSNTSWGVQALLSNTTGSGNTALGANALVGNTEGQNNTALGLAALQGNVTGFFNTAVGSLASANNISGSDNAAFGYRALYQDTGNANTAVGNYSLENNVSGNFNTSIGYSSMGGNNTGSYNTTIGSNSFTINISGSENTMIGHGADVLDTSLTGSTAIGSGAKVGVDYGLILGDTANAKVGIHTGFPLYPLDVHGQFKLADGTEGVNKVLTSDVNGLASWSDNNTVVAHYDSAGATGAIASLATYTPSSNGTFAISGHVNVTAIVTNVITFKVSYTDENSNSVTQIIPLTLATTGVVGTTATTAFQHSAITINIRCKSGSAITVLTTATGVGSETYDVGGVITKLY